MATFPFERRQEAAHARQQVGAPSGGAPDTTVPNPDGAGGAPSPADAEEAERLRVAIREWRGELVGSEWDAIVKGHLGTVTPEKTADVAALRACKAALAAATEKH